jgi:hypothetical protein
VETYRKKTPRTTKKKMVKCCGRRLEDNRGSRLERISPGQRKMEEFSGSGENS